MKKIIIAALLALTMTACSDTNTAEVTTMSAEITESITTVSEETILSVSETEETTSAETTSTAAETEETNAATEITRIQPVLSEDIYGLDAAKSTDEINGYSSLPENNIPYLLWQSDNGDMSIYGVMTDKVVNDYGDYKEFGEIIIIRHDNMIETFECKWRGMAWGEPMEITALNESQNTIFGTVINETGTYTCVEGAVLFSLNSNGNYEMFTIDNETVLSDIRDRITITLDNEQDIVSFSADGIEYTTETASINSYLQMLMSDDNIKVEREKILISDSYCTYSCDSDEEIIFTTEYRAADESVVTVDAEISFNNGEFTVEKIKKIYR